LELISPDLQGWLLAALARIPSYPRRAFSWTVLAKALHETPMPEGEAVGTGNEGGGGAAHKVTKGGEAHKVPEGGEAHKVPEGGEARKVTEGGEAHAVPAGGAAHKVPACGETYTHI